jgi:hypothetical protein
LSEIISGELTISPQHPEVKFFSLEEINLLEENHQLRSPYIHLAINDYLNTKYIDLNFLTILK